MREAAEIRVFGFCVNNGDGGGGTTVYNNEEHYIREGLKRGGSREALKDRWEKALRGDYPYEVGEISEKALRLEKVDGKWQLAESVNFHWGS